MDFLPSSEKVEAWDNVFDIRTRYKRDVLDQNFDRWVGDFSKKYAMDRSRNLISADMTDEQVKERLSFYCEDKSETPSIREGFLEPKIFEYLLAECDINLARDAVEDAA